MGRSRTMNDTRFTIYTNCVSADDEMESSNGLEDIKVQPLTRRLYVANCDQKMAGNLSSIYQTLIALLNFSVESFYFSDQIVNAFLEKMKMSIGAKVARHIRELTRKVLGQRAPSRILTQILAAKLRLSPLQSVAECDLSADGVVENLVTAIVWQKFEQRKASGDIFDDLIRLLSGEQKSLMEISYTKQQQKQKQKQRNRSHDADTMAMFARRHQISLSVSTDDYFAYAMNPARDVPRLALGMPLTESIVKVTYCPTTTSERKTICVYPTLQFLYSHHIEAEYISEEVKAMVKQSAGRAEGYDRFVATVLGSESKSDDSDDDEESNVVVDESESDALQRLRVRVARCLVRQSPQYTMAALAEGVYCIGMKDQWNVHDLASHPLQARVEFIFDEMGFVLFSRSDGNDSRSVDAFGPYFIEQYILMEVLSKHELAQNVLDYYVNHKAQLTEILATYNEAQGKGFVCWRFLMNEAVKAARTRAAKDKDAEK